MKKRAADFGMNAEMLAKNDRVIDGALATRFNVYLEQLLADFRRVML